MRIIKSTVAKLAINNVPRLDPITVFLEDFGPRKGSITIKCFDRSWTAYWGGMGDRGVSEFFASVSVGYATESLSQGIKSTVFDPDAAKAHAKAIIRKDRRSRDLSADKARELFDDIEWAEISDDPWRHNDLMQEIYGDEWWCQLPEKPNPDYQYLCRIVAAVQAAIKQDSTVAEPA